MIHPTDEIQAYLRPNLASWKTNAMELVERYADPHEAFEMLTKRIRNAVEASGLSIQGTDYRFLAGWIQREAGL